MCKNNHHGEDRKTNATDRHVNTSSMKTDSNSKEQALDQYITNVMCHKA